MKAIRLASIAAAGLLSVLAWAQQQPGPKVHDAMRGPTPVNELTKPPLLGNQVNDDIRPQRNFDKQPPTIPHRIDGYQIDKNFNKCLDCHAKAKTEFSQATPVSSTHYMDRSGKVLGEVSTRRYFCVQCHVPQERARSR